MVILITNIPFNVDWNARDSYAHILSVVVSNSATTGGITNPNVDVRLTGQPTSASVRVDAPMKKVSISIIATHAVALLAMSVVASSDY